MGISTHEARTHSRAARVDLRSNGSANCSHRNIEANDAYGVEAPEEVAVAAAAKREEAVSVAVDDWTCQVKVDIR